MTARVAHIAGLVVLGALALLALGVALLPASGGPALQLATRAGFGAVDVRADGRTRWLEGDAGRIELTVRDRARPVFLVLELSSFAQDRWVTVSVDGRSVAEGAVPPSRFVILRAGLGTLASGRHDVVVRAAPGPQSIAESVGVPDPRVVSVRMRGFSATEGDAP